jgi:O-antigen/teichoic acid export membrane protein
VKSGVGLTIATRLLLITAGIATSIITARTLGPVGRGDYFFIVTLTASIVQVTNLGLHSSNTYLVAKDERLLGSLVANSLWISLLLGGGLGSLAALVAWQAELFPQTPSEYLWVVPALASVTLFFMLGTNLLVGVERIVAYNAVEATSRIVVLVLLAAAGLAAFSVSGFLAVSLASWALAAAGLLVLLRRSSRESLAFRFDTLRAGMRFAAKAYVIALASFLVLRVSVFLLARLYSSVEVGYFSVAIQFTDVLGILPGSVALLLFPRLVRGHDGWEQTVRACFAVAGLLALASLVLAVTANPVVRLLFGDEYLPAVPILRWLLPGAVGLGITSVLSQYLGSVGIPRSLVAAWGVGVVLMLALGRLLIPSYGGVGAAIAFSITAGALLAMVTGLSLSHRRETAAGEHLALTQDPLSSGGAG